MLDSLSCSRIGGWLAGRVRQHRGRDNRLDHTWRFGVHSVDGLVLLAIMEVGGTIEARDFLKELFNDNCYVHLRFVTLRFVTLRFVTLRFVTLRFVTLRFGLELTLQLFDRIKGVMDLARLLLRPFPAASLGADQFVFSVTVDVQPLHAIASRPI
jgi:hypothetical protein